jgi:hypothetical protein
MIVSPARTLSVLLIAITIAAFVACHAATAPLPENSRQVPAPPVYQMWWSMIESCSGRAGDLGAVDWYVVPGVAQFEHRGAMVSG